MNFYDILFARKLAGGGGDIPPHSYQLKSIENTPTAIATFNGTALPMPSLSVGIEAVQSGTGDPSPTNVRPISGWSAVNVNRFNINMWDEEWELGYWGNGVKEPSASNIRSTNKIPIMPNTTYYLFIPSTFYYTYYDAVGNVLPQSGYDAQSRLNKLTAGTITTPAGAYYMTFNMGSGYGTTYNNDISINYPSTDTEYHAYSGTTYTIDLKDGQGNPLTCYGGTLTNENGVQRLELTHGHIASYNGETLPSTWISDRDVYAEGTTPTIGAEVVYLLATPEEILQDNLPIASQSGTNNLWADSGDVLSGEYFVEL